MFSPRPQMNVINNVNDELDSRLQNFESDLKKDLRVNCRENFNEYLNVSTLHGLRYVGDRSISRFERIFFACMFFLVVLMSGYLISIVWLKWSQSPIVITFSSRASSVRDIPFPAVTLCNMNIVSKAAVRNIPKDSNQFAVVQALCRGESSVGNSSNVETGSWKKFFKVLLKVTTPIDEVFLSCWYGGQQFNCSSKFQTLLTDDGFCYSFNGVDKKFLLGLQKIHNVTAKDVQNAWTVEKGYSSEEKSEKYPLPGITSGNGYGLSLIMKSDANDYFCSSTESSGFKVLVHNPNDLPNVAHIGKAIGSNFESRFAVTPTLSIGEPSIRKLSIDNRKCIFDNENFLSYYSFYSETNCNSECESSHYYNRCKCVKHFHPTPNNSISICGVEDLKCTQWLDRQMLMKNPSFSCSQCLPGCYDLKYESTFSMARIFDQLLYLEEKNLKPENLAILHVYYTQSMFRAQKKEELVGFSEFLANLGGLLGLFLGFSGFSIVEVFYFTSIRPYCQHLRLSNSRREIMKKLTQKIDEIRNKHRRNRVYPKLSFDQTYHQNHFD